MQSSSDDSSIFLGGLSQTFLRRLLWLVAGLNVALGVQSAWANDFQPSRYLDNASVAAVALIGLYILPRWGFRAALAWLIWGTWSALCAFMSLRNGLRDPSALAFPLLLVLAGWLLGRTHAVRMIVGTAMVAVALAIANYTGYLDTSGAPSYSFLTIVFLAILVIGSMISLAVGNSVMLQHRRVVELNQALEQRIDERTRHLAEVNEELALAFETLKRTQSELVQSERLASLGSMVAGVAHELNTPIGNIVTAASTLAFNVKEFEAQSRAPSMKRSSIDEFLASTADISQLLLRSSERAADLVSSFKRVAVDRTSEHRRTFDVLVAIKELMTMLEPTLRQSRCEIRVKGSPEGLVIDSYPGSFEQVLSNLVINATVHGFEGQAPGSVEIHVTGLHTADHASQRGDYELVRIDVVDNGRGMDSKIVQRIFEPFFTTRMGRGGSGLGLSISYNIVTQILGGTLKVHSEPGKGSTFSMTIPVCAPQSPSPLQS